MAVKDVLLQNAEFITKTASTINIKEMNTFNKICKGYRIGREYDCITKLCNERIRIYINNDNTQEKIRQCLMLCDTVIKTLEFNMKIIKRIATSD